MNSQLEYGHVPVEYRIHQAEYIIHIIVAASQEYVIPIQHVGCRGARSLPWLLV